MTTTEMPPLPVIGALGWGPDVNACLTWLYEQMDANADAIAAQATQIATLNSLCNTQADQIDRLDVLVSALETVVADQDTRIAALEAKPEFVFTSSSWQYSNAAPPATGSQVRLNNTNLSLATLIDIRLIDNDGADRTNWIRALGAAGSLIQISDWNNSQASHRYKVVGTPTLGATNAQIPIEWTTGTGVIPNAKANVGFLVVLNL